MKLGLVGYGFGGRWFHAPFVRASGAEITGVVARAPATIANVRADLPDVPVFSSLGEMIAAGVCEAVTITTPPQTRVALVLEAIGAGLHVMADKPFAYHTEDARRMIAAAEAQGVVLTVFHNRRWDADLRTLAALIEQDALGPISRVHNRMDFPSLDGLLPGPEGGLLGDLGTHIVDQMLWLLGPAEAVTAQLVDGAVPGGRTEVSFAITLRHVSGAHSHIEASKANNLFARDLRAYGAKGAFVVEGADAQVRAVLNGDLPIENHPAWGTEPEASWGTLHTAEGARRIPSVRTRYVEIYEAFVNAVRSGTAPPVSPDSALHTVAVLNAARASAAQGATVTL